MLTLAILPLLLRAPTSTECDPMLAAHVYHPHRLRLIQECVQVSGVLIGCKNERDGDKHCQVRLDPEFSWMLNLKNVDKQNRALVVEPICVTTVRQKDAEEACFAFQGADPKMPKRGSRVTVIGTFVYDRQHGWNEIHPARFEKGKLNGLAQDSYSTLATDALYPETDYAGTGDLCT